MVRSSYLLGGVLLSASMVACGGGGGGGGGSGVSGDSFRLDYRSGASALLDLTVKADLRFTGARPAVPATLSSIRVGRALAQVRGNGQQPIEVVLSTGRELYDGDTFYVRLEFSRANDGEVLDRGGTLDMGCQFGWAGADYDTLIWGDCRVRQTNGGYSLTILTTEEGETGLTGTVAFSPVSNQSYGNTPGHGCGSDTICLSLDASDYEADTGYCLPASNLKADALPCTSSCTSKLKIETGGATTCVCSSPCGFIPTGTAGDPPVCDPAYGCIDF